MKKYELMRRAGGLYHTTNNPLQKGVVVMKYSKRNSITIRHVIGKYDLLKNKIIPRKRANTDDIKYIQEIMRGQ